MDLKSGWSIVAKLYENILPSMGAMKSFPLVYRWALTKYFGLNLPHPYIKQGIGQAKLLLRHAEGTSEAGTLLRASYKQLQLEVGTDECLFQLSFAEFGFLATECWIKSLWEFLWKYDIQWQQEHHPKSPRRMGDRLIMEWLREHHPSNHELEAINQCRLKIQALWLSDIVTADRTKLRNGIMVASANCSRFYNEIGPYPVQNPLQQTLRYGKVC